MDPVLAPADHLPDAAEPAASAAPAPAPEVAPTTRASSSADLAKLPRAGIQPLLDSMRRALRARLAALTVLAGKLGPSTKKVGAKLGARSMRFAREVRPRLPPAKAVGAWVAGLGAKARARLPSASVLRPETRPRWFLPVVAVAGLVVGVGLMGILAGAFGKSRDETSAREPKPQQPQNLGGGVRRASPVAVASPGRGTTERGPESHAVYRGRLPARRRAAGDRGRWSRGRRDGR